MRKNYKLISVLLSVIMILTFLIAGCVNYDQKTTLKEDGSGSMKIHYWTKMSNFSMGSTLGKFEFEETKAKSKYSSSNTDVKSLLVEEKLDDSTKHVNLELSFKDINKISDAKGFDGVKASWKEATDGMELKYVLLKDTSASKNMGASEYKITYEFEMPSEIVSTNGNKDGQKVSWEYSVADLSKDIELTVVVKKAKGKTCGIFGFIGASLLIGLAFYTQRNKNKLLN
jgi:hypothetical protein